MANMARQEALTSYMIELNDTEKSPVPPVCASEGTKLQSLSEIQQVISRYVTQLLNGCGEPTCANSFCDSGRRNCTERPVRKYTPRSARAVAITLANGPKPRSRFCKEHSFAMNDECHKPAAEGERDPAAFGQLLSDTQSVRNICRPARVTSEDETQRVNPKSNRAERDSSVLRDWNATLDSISADNCLLLDSRDVLDHAADTLYACIHWLLARLPQGRQPQWKYAIELISSGCVYPEKNQDVPCDSSFNNWLYLLDALEHGPYFRLFCRTLEEVSKYCALQNRHREARDLSNEPHFVSKARVRIDLIVRLAGKLSQNFSKSDISTSRRLALFAWLKKAFLRHWDSSAILEYSSVPFVSLSLLKLLVEYSYKNSLQTLSYVSTIGAVTRRMNIMDMATTWLNGPREQHLLAFSFIFNLKQQATYFRGINFARMMAATLSSRKLSELRSRHPRPSDSDYADTDQLKYFEENYLLLNISRGEVLKDAFDQLWQRRKGELFRPLRVRLGEMDTFEIGHDLGGVQIEFFNLLCKELFRESAQMFTTDPTTGYSYFRSCSMQPLYMFELCGLAFALALYNGISLPVNFPQAFYLILTKQPCDGPASIADAWPVINRSLENILREDVPGLERTFSLEANGLRLAVVDSIGSARDPSGLHSMYVLDATPIMHHESGPLDQCKPDGTSSHAPPNSPIDTLREITHAWPGWHILPWNFKTTEVTSKNKHYYVQSYVNWLTYGSVSPQWNAFLRGFQQLFPPDYLHTLSTWRHLRSILEGSPDFNVSDLRNITQYEDGYDAQSKYIQSFWRLVTSWPKDKQRALLKFVTACERVPAGGAGSLTFKIKKAPVADAEEGRLPTSSTCFGTLVLPKYESVAVLDTKLSLALKYGVEGFGSA